MQGFVDPNTKKDAILENEVLKHIPLETPPDIIVPLTRTTLHR
jgi:hypothetical protein